jgi:hypothetical protein
VPALITAGYGQKIQLQINGETTMAAQSGLMALMLLPQTQDIITVTMVED